MERKCLVIFYYIYYSIENSFNNDKQRSVKAIQIIVFSTSSYKSERTLAHRSFKKLVIISIRLLSGVLDLGVNNKIKLTKI